MNPTQELKKKQKNLKKEIEEDKKNGLSWTICHQHRKCLYHFQEMLVGITEAESRTEIIKVLRNNYSQFNKSLIEAQKSAENMEKGLERRKKYLKGINAEKDYQFFKNQ